VKKKRVQIWVLYASPIFWKYVSKISDESHPVYNELVLSFVENGNPTWVGTSTARRHKKFIPKLYEIK
jgi:hypothetical protein